jgi:hypothetical protein
MMIAKKMLRSTSILLLLILCLCGYANAAEYLPLQVGTRWVLKHPGTDRPVIIEVTAKNGNAYRVRFTHPWGANEWDLEPHNPKIYMTAYGENGNLAPMPSSTVFFSFVGNQGEKWTNAIGSISVLGSRLTIKGGNQSFQDCVQIKQVSGNSSFFYTFAPGIGFVQFGEGKNAFVLDTSASILPGAAATQAASDDRPAQHVPGGVLGPGTNSASGIKRNVPPRKADSRSLNVGITASTFANEDSSPQNLLKRFDQTSQAGITFLSSALKWTEIEQKPGQFNLEGLDFQISNASRLNVPMSVTLRIIDTVDRVTPNELKRVAWDSPEMSKRVLPLVDALSSRFYGHVKWFMFGNEIDGYFGRHPDEIQSYARLFAMVKEHVKQRSPRTLVSSTVMFGGVDALDGALAPLNDRYDFVSITYYPIRGNFTMRPPSVVFADFDKMRAIANGRKVILQEIGYPSSSLNESSQDKQAEFYKDVFQAMRQNRDLVEAGSFFLLADLSDKFVRDLAGFYGMPGQKVFLAYLQTLGVFDLQGKPKKSWNVFQAEMRQQHLLAN